MSAVSFAHHFGEMSPEANFVNALISRLPQDQRDAVFAHHKAAGYPGTSEVVMTIDGQSVDPTIMVKLLNERIDELSKIRAAAMVANTDSLKSAAEKFATLSSAFDHITDEMKRVLEPAFKAAGFDDWVIRHALDLR